MTGAEILTAIEQGLKVRLPEWKGYWKGVEDTHGRLHILVFTHDGKILDTPDSHYLFRDDWEICP